jgi:NDP-sugar pyrophosphorylase family protein
MHGLDAHRSPSLLPLVDRPALQHIVESLVAGKITTIELIVGYMPEQVEALLGNGDRWGCKLRYHLAVEPERPYRSLKIIAETATHPWLLVHAERFPCVEFPVVPFDKAIAYYSASHDQPEGDVIAAREPAKWGGAVIFPAGIASEEFVHQTTGQLSRYVRRLIAEEQATVVTTPHWIDASTPGALLETQERLLSGRLGRLSIGGIERQPGVRVARGALIHPTARLVPPLYIGPNSRISRGVSVGPNAVVSGDCIVDVNTVIEDALIMRGSYIGAGLEVKGAVVDHNLLVNVGIGASIDILDDFLLGSHERRLSTNWLGRTAQSFVAVLLMLVFLPLSLLSRLYLARVRHLRYTFVKAVRLPARATSHRRFALPCIGKDAWSVQRPAGWDALLRQFLPGLAAVVSGRLSLVGLPPRTPEQMRRLPSDWRTMCFAGKAGLITEASVASTDPEDETQLYLADAYYSVQRSWRHDLRLACRYFLRLLAPARSD